jgi:hypothetical protein
MTQQIPHGKLPAVTRADLTRVRAEYDAQSAELAAVQRLLEAAPDAQLAVDSGVLEALQVSVPNPIPATPPIGRRC